MKIEEFVNALEADFFVGVPDSQLKALCDYLIYKYGINGTNHIIAAKRLSFICKTAERGTLSIPLLRF